MRAHTRAWGLALWGLAGLCGCAAADPSPEPDLFDVPLAGASAEEKLAFSQGDALFELQLRDADGLGPLYTRQSCGACHQGGTRGPGFVQKMAVVEADGMTPATDQSLLAFGNTVHPLTTAGATTPILPPAGSVRVTSRTGPPVLGRGYIEAVDDAEIERIAAEQAARADAIHGRINHVIYTSEANPDPRYSSPAKGSVLIGRFGVKARVGTLDDFTADAFQNDMGITSPLRPDEIANPDGLTDDLKPGLDVTADSVNQRAGYLRLIAIPRRVELDSSGASLFDQAQCSACHVPSLRTRTDYPVALLAGIDAPLYSDLLLHDLGSGLSDSVVGTDGEAGPRDWRTAPLIGLRFNRVFLHDGRAATVEDAVLAHDSPGSEASDSVHRFQGFTTAQQQALLTFVQSL